ncbi:hypothetical protein GCM10020254_70280 [Streptomyces goshikiensis]
MRGDGERDTAGVRGVRPGRRPALVLLHALGQSAGHWAPVRDALAPGRRVYALDLRGHGRSEWPGRYSLELMRDDVLGFLDALGLDRVELVGHSLGGVVAYLLAAQRPHRVTRLVLEDAPAPLPREPVARVRPEGDLDFDWAMVLAVRQELDRPPADRLAALERISAPHPGPLRRPRQPPPGRLLRRGDPPRPRRPDGHPPVRPPDPRGRAAEFAEAVTAFLTASAPASR